MNTEPIVKSLKEQALELNKGDDQEQAFSQQAFALAVAIEKHSKTTENPITAETFKGIEVGGGDPRLTKPFPRSESNPSQKQ